MIFPLNRDFKILDDNGYLTLRATSFFEEITRAVNLNTPLLGAGSPEGVVAAEITQRYMDTAGSAENVEYIKQTGSGNTGWKLI